jgi:hypothetical protein
MLTRNEPQPMVGLTHLDITTISNSAVAFLNVTDEVNQNLTASQKELLLWHWRLGHAHFQWIQMLAAKPKDNRVIM